MIKLSAKVEERELRKYLARLDKNHGKPFLQRAERTIKAAAQRVLVPPIKVAAKGTSRRYEAGGKARKGNLSRKTKAKFLRKRGREPIRPTWVGSTAWYSHIVVGGSQAHNLGSRGRPFVAFRTDEVRRAQDVEHPGARAKPFIDRGVDGAMPRFEALVKRDVFAVK